jgi:hypothetical protein
MALADMGGAKMVTFTVRLGARTDAAAFNGVEARTWLATMPGDAVYALDVAGGATAVRVGLGEGIVASAPSGGEGTVWFAMSVGDGAVAAAVAFCGVTPGPTLGMANDAAAVCGGAIAPIPGTGDGAYAAAASGPGGNTHATAGDGE